MVRASFVKQYADADAAGRVDIICKNYPIFLGIVDSSTDGLIYVIESEKEYNKRSVNHGDKMYKNHAQKMYNQPPIN